MVARGDALLPHDPQTPRIAAWSGRRDEHRSAARGSAPNVEPRTMRSSVIVSAVRTPTGKFLGALKGFTAPQLGALVVREAVRRAGIDPTIVDECIMGNVVSAGEGQSPERQAALNGGLPDHETTLNVR